MNDRRIIPEKITKPIQLLAAWLVGLILVNGSFLLGAQQISRPDWASALLVVASVINVPIFIGALFLLQTKFRPQIQEDSYYAQYLQYSAQAASTVNNAKAVEEEITHATERIVESLGPVGKGKEKPIGDILRESQLESLVTRFGSSRSLAELYVSPETWTVIVERWGKNSDFISDIERLLSEGLVEKKFKGYRNCKLTELGKQVAEAAEKQLKLFSQVKEDFWKRKHAELTEET